MTDIAAPESPTTELLVYSPEVAKATDHIYPKIQHLVTEAEWQLYAPLIDATRRLKEQRNACILAHNYQAPEIFSGISDYTGDSLGLARQAARSKADIIVMCGVHFMAETAKLLNPERVVLIPDTEAGCSLAELRQVLWRRFGLVRSAAGLGLALETLDRLAAGVGAI